MNRSHHQHERDGLHVKLHWTGPASRYEQVQVVIGMRWTVEPGVPLHRVQTEHDTVAKAPGQPHKDVAGDDVANEEHCKAYATE